MCAPPPPHCSQLARSVVSSTACGPSCRDPTLAAGAHRNQLDGVQRGGGGSHSHPPTFAAGARGVNSMACGCWEGCGIEHLLLRLSQCAQVLEDAHGARRTPSDETLRRMLPGASGGG
eukprot:5538525-Pleurochrysis_carterae.AAC.1